jgi:hypothetical protein
LLACSRQQLSLGSAKLAWHEDRFALTAARVRSPTCMPAGGSYRRRASHVVMQKSEPAGTITVPGPDHAELRRGPLRSIIRQSGLEKAEFETD